MNRITGKVAWFSDNKGYGFLQADGVAGDIFVHYSAVQGVDLKTLKEGQSVSFELVEGPKGSQAYNLTVM